MERLASVAVTCERRPDGTLWLRSDVPAAVPERTILAPLQRWAVEWPDRPFLAERDGEGWRSISYAQAYAAARDLAPRLLGIGCAPERPLMLLSGNSIAHATMALAAMLVGVPVAPISPAYALLSSDHAKLRAIAAALTPGAIWAEREAPFAAALTAVASHAPLLADEPGATAIRLDTIAPSGDATAAAKSVGPGTVAKILFTSGSTGSPKGVVNTHAMLCHNQAGLRAVWPLLAERPPILVDWLPWNHTFGGNVCFNLVLFNGGTLYIDDGRPTAIARTLDNLSRVRPTIHFNVPAGFEALLGQLDDDGLARSFFDRLDFLFFAGAALPQAAFDALGAAARRVGRDPAILSGWGSTETAPFCTVTHARTSVARSIGVPMPDVTVALVPSGDRHELRVRGANVTPGYWRDPAATAAAFDANGFYRIGDAGRLLDPIDPAQGIAFDGRVAENFKLASGTWVNAGALRLAAIDACRPHVRDAVIAGHDRECVGVLLFLAHPLDDFARAAIHDGLARHNAAQTGSSFRFGRLAMLDEPPSADAGEITDKGYLNQRACLARRAAIVDAMFADDNARL